jgi:16S rRNA (guanine966-N2)-methyltransferase
MRVITGKAKGRKLQMVPGDTTRPITDRAKEALFSILSDWIVDARVLDLFGGTGAVGIESLSRGAEFVQFLDLSRKAVETITANLRHCRLESQAAVERTDAFQYLQRYRGQPFDLVYVAPPQYQGLWSKALALIDSRPELLTEYGSVIVQIHPREDAPLTLSYLQEYDRRRYGSVLFIFYASAAALAEDEDEEDAGDAEDGGGEDGGGEDVDTGMDEGIETGEDENLAA